MTRRSLLLALLALGFLPRRARAANGSARLLDCQLELIELRTKLGEAHPRMVSLKDRIAGLEAAGVRIDPAAAEERFVQLFTARTTMRRTHGLSHPEVLGTTRQIGYLASSSRRRADEGGTARQRSFRNARQ